MSPGRTRGIGCGVVLLLGLCILAGLAGAGFYLVPNLAEQDFGPPNARLGRVQQALVAWQLLTSREELLQSADPNGQEQEFTIQMGESANSVAFRLEESGLVRGSDSFRNYLIYSGLDTSIQAGKYRLSPSMTGVEIAKALQDATPKEVEFNILAGWRVEEIAQALPTSGLSVTPAEFLELVRHPSPDLLPTGLSIEGSLEGFLLPGSYQVPRDSGAKALIGLFLARFSQDVTEEMRAAYQSQGLSLSQAVILASIVQREAVLSEEQAMIASVFYNRLGSGMKLESDPTVQYALGFDPSKGTWWTNPLNADDLRKDSPYNTYMNPGLPPGPISNPGLPALKAVAYPAKTPYFYFRAACDQSGRHNFSKTFDEHVQNGCN